MREERQRLADARDHAEHALETVRTGSLPWFEVRTLRQSLIFDMLVIGEALSGISKDVRGLAPAIPWRDIVDTRNRLIHRNWSIDPSLLAGILSTDLPPLTTAIDELLRTIELAGE